MSAELSISPVTLRPAQVATYLSVTIETLARWREQGTGPAYIKTGSSRQSAVLYRVSDVDAWLDQNAVEGASR